jgi:GAF domain-containing protein
VELASLNRVRQLALTLHRQAARHRHREAGLTALLGAARDLAAAESLDALLRTVCRQARVLLGTELAYAALPGPDGALVVRAVDGHAAHFVPGGRLPDGLRGLPGAFWTADVLADDRVGRDPGVRGLLRGEGVRALLAVPLPLGPGSGSGSGGPGPGPADGPGAGAGGGEGEGEAADGAAGWAGVLCVAERRVRHHSADDVSLLGALGDLAALAVERARSVRESAATRDALRRAERAAVIGAELVEAALSGAEAAALAARAADLIGGECSVRLHAPDTTVLAEAGELPAGQDSLSTVLAGMRAHQAGGPVADESGVWSVPVRAGEDMLGTLLLHAPDAAPADPLAAGASDLPGGADAVPRAVAQGFAVLLQLDRSRSAAADGRLRDELLDALLSARDGTLQPGELRERALRLGVDLALPHVLAVARPARDAHSRAAVWAAAYARRLRGLTTPREGGIVLLLPGSAAGETAREVSRHLARLLGGPVTVAGSGPLRGAGEVPEGYREALRCLEALTALGAEGRAGAADELGFLGVLLSGRRDAVGFVEATIGTVLDYDRQRCTELERTLRAYFAAGGSPTHAAQRLFVHANTVARRLERIGELLGADWQRPERALEIQLALRLSEVRGGLFADPPPPTSPSSPHSPPATPSSPSSRSAAPAPERAGAGPDARRGAYRAAVPEPSGCGRRPPGGPSAPPPG